MLLPIGGSSALLPPQKYLTLSQSMSGDDASELGATVAEQFGRAIGPVQRHLSEFLLRMFCVFMLID